MSQTPLASFFALLCCVHALPPRTSCAPSATSCLTLPLPPLLPPLPRRLRLRPAAPGQQGRDGAQVLPRGGAHERALGHGGGGGCVRACVRAWQGGAARGCGVGGSQFWAACMFLSSSGTPTHLPPPTHTHLLHRHPVHRPGGRGRQLVGDGRQRAVVVRPQDAGGGGGGAVCRAGVVPRQGLRDHRRGARLPGGRGRWRGGRGAKADDFCR